jgi:hypothetical protein
MADLLGGVVPLPNQLVHKLRHKGDHRVIVRDVREDALGDLRVRTTLGLRLATVFRSIVDDSLHTRAGRAVYIGQPAERE